MPEITYRKAIHDAMVEEMRRDERVFLIGEDIGVYGGAFGVSQGMLDCRNNVYGFHPISYGATG